MNTLGTFVFGIAASLALTVTVVVWPVMLLIGALHTYWPAIPPLGFQATLILVLIVWLLTNPPTITSSSSR
jgi:hypothetical protein